MSALGLFRQVVRFLGFKIPQSRSWFTDVLDVSSRVRRAFEIPTPTSVWQKAISDLRTMADQAENRLYLRSAELREKIPSNLLSEGEIFRDRNYYVTMSVHVKDSKTGKESDIWVSTYDDVLMSPAEHLAGANIEGESTRYNAGSEFSVNFVDSVIHNAGFPYD